MPARHSHEAKKNRRIVKKEQEGMSERVLVRCDTCKRVTYKTRKHSSDEAIYDVFGYTCATCDAADDAARAMQGLRVR